MILIGIAVAGLLGVPTGCGSTGSGAASVAATTGLVADLTERVAGPDAEVQQIIPDSSSPHDFQLSVEDRRRLEDAVLVAASGAGLEQGIPLDDVDSPRWELAEHVGKLRPFEEGGSDPHVWMDPTNVARALPSLADALAEADPEHAAGYRARAAAFAVELNELDAEIRRRVEEIPKADRKLVTSHDALGYFADRYGFEVVATTFPASGPEAEPSAARLRDVEAAVRSSGVPTVFAEDTDDPKVLRKVADDTGVEIETGLLVEAPGSAGSYLEMLRHDAELLANGLNP